MKNKTESKWTKTIAVMLCCILMAFGFTACGKKTPEVNKNALPMIMDAETALKCVKDSSLTKEQMNATIDEYFDIFNEVFEHTKENISVEVVHSGKKVSVITKQPDPADATKTITETAFEWKSTEKAYAYLLEQGVVNLKGEMTTEKEELLSVLSNTFSTPAADTE